jgi:hypothetical protein
MAIAELLSLFADEDFLLRVLAADRRRVQPKSPV